MENQEPAIRIPPGYTKAIISFILGIFGILIFFTSILNILAIMAIVQGRNALYEYRKSSFEKGKKFAITGIILGFLSIMLYPLIYLIDLGYHSIFK